MKRIIASLASVAIISTGIAFLSPAPTAQARCPEVGLTQYYFKKKSTSWKRTNLSSSYVHGPGEVSLTKGSSWSVSASMTATVSAEAGAIFAKASASLGVTVGASAGGNQSLEYVLKVPKGKTMRMQQYRRAVKFTVTKTKIYAPCRVRTIYTQTVYAPVRGSSPKYFMYKLVK